MIATVSLLTGLITVWAQLNNYGIDSQKYPHLKNVRVRREIERLYDVQNKVHNTTTNIQHDSVIMKSILNGIELNRIKRQTYNNLQYRNDNVEVRIPLANYPPNSPYYSQNTAGVPYYYNGNNNAYNGNNNAYNGNNNTYIQNNNNGYNIPNNNGYVNGRNGTIIGQNYQPNTQYKSEKYVMPTDLKLSNGYTITSNNRYQTHNSYLNQESNNIYRNVSNNTFGSTNNQIYTNSNSRQFYNPFSGKPHGNNQTFIPVNNNNGTHNNRDIYTYNNNGYNAITLNNGNNNTVLNGNNNNTFYSGNNNTDNGNNNKNKNVVRSYFMSGLGCPEFMKSVTIFGTKVCVDNDYD